MIQKLKNYLWHWPKAVVASAWYGFPARKLTMIGVTGTKGKTTTAHMIYYILNRAYGSWGDDPRRHFFGTLGQEPSLTSSSPPGQSTSRILSGSSSMTSKMASSDHLLDRKVKLNGRVGLISTIGAFFGDEEIDTGLHVTSPDPRELQKLLKMAVDKGLTHVVLEVTSSGLDQFRVWGIKFRVAVITNIYPDHLDYHGTMEKYVEAKARIIKQSEVVVLPKNFRYFSELKEIINQKSKVKGQRPKVIFFSEDKSIVSANEAAAAAAEKALSIKETPWLTPRSLLFRDFPGVPGRMETVYDKNFKVVIDFAHTPESLAAALGDLRKLVKKNGRLIAVFGCAGDRDHGRRRMGEVAAEMADLFVITAEDPRTERVEEILEEIAGWARAAGAIELTTSGSCQSPPPRNTRKGSLPGGPPAIATPHSFIRIPDRQEAINYAISMAKQGDVVGLFGKGHEKSMAFGREEKPWSEYEAVRRALDIAQRK